LEKARLFEAFITPDLKVSSTKRGEKGMEETICTQAVRNCVNAKARQNRERDKAIDLLDIQIANNDLNKNKILILNADDMDIPYTLTGLCAMGVSANHKKPVMLGRISKDGYLRGSIRGRGESELKDFRKFLLESGLMEFVEGHGNAAGFGIKESNIDKLLEYSNEKLANVNFNEGFYEADFVVKGNCSYLKNLIEDMDRGAKLWGQGNEEPMIVVEDITLQPGGYSIIGKNSDTIRFEFNGITYVKFKATELIEELKQKSGKLSIAAAGKGKINEWGGYRKPQILVDEIEIKELNDYDF
jgi:single-stranded-DNA-specific exonuclease